MKVLKKDDKLLKFFIENYQPGVDANDDEKYISFEFSKFSEQGWSNDAIFDRIREELAEGRFGAPELTDRQIRRRIYG